MKKTKVADVAVLFKYQDRDHCPVNWALAENTHNFNYEFNNEAPRTNSDYLAIKNDKSIHTPEYYLRHYGIKSVSTLYPNFREIPCTTLASNIERERNKFNNIYRALIKYWPFKGVPRTKSGGIKLGKRSFKVNSYFKCFDIIRDRKGIVLTICDGDYNWYKIYSYSNHINRDDVQMYKEYSKMVGELKSRDSDHVLDSIACKDIKEGMQVKNEIEKAERVLFPEYKEIEIRNEIIWDLDINSAWPFYACQEFPILKPYFETLFRKKNEIKAKYGKSSVQYAQIKTIINGILGYCQSQFSGYKYARFARAGVNGTNKALREYVEALRSKGYKVIMTATDGIVVYKPGNKDPDLIKKEMAENIPFGSEFGQVKIDSISDGFWGRSSNAYCLINKDNSIKVRLSGLCKLDHLKPDRDTWTLDEFKNLKDISDNVVFKKGIGYIIVDKPMEE